MPAREQKLGPPTARASAALRDTVCVPLLVSARAKAREVVAHMRGHEVVLTGGRMVPVLFELLGQSFECRSAVVVAGRAGIRKLASRVIVPIVQGCLIRIRQTPLALCGLCTLAVPARHSCSCSGGDEDRCFLLQVKFGLSAETIGQRLLGRPAAVGGDVAWVAEPLRPRAAVQCTRDAA
jgi:hypothetical protein